MVVHALPEAWILGIGLRYMGRSHACIARFKSLHVFERMVKVIPHPAPWKPMQITCIESNSVVHGQWQLNWHGRHQLSISDPE